jgi:hypothetical protein
VTLVDLLVGSLVMTAVMGGVLAALAPGQAAFVSQADAIDGMQRLRAAVDTLSREVRGASLAFPDGAGLGVRRGEARRVYYVGRQRDLRRADEGGADLPVVDGVVHFAVEYYDTDGVGIAAATLADGPWLPDAGDPDRFDADLLRVARVRLYLTVTAGASARGTAIDVMLRGGPAASWP